MNDHELHAHADHYQTLAENLGDRLRILNVCHRFCARKRNAGGVLRTRQPEDSAYLNTFANEAVMPETADEIEQFVHEYAEEFSTADPEVIATHFHEPTTLLTGDGVLVLESQADVESLFTGILDELCERGYDASEVGELDVEVLGPDRARATVEWIRYATSGKELERLVVTHLFRRTDDGWKMAVLAPHED